MNKLRFYEKVKKIIFSDLIVIAISPANIFSACVLANSTYNVSFAV